ncbi:hypothetical protein HBB16_08810 [Pseudonocardia sp. MCCB 268]|nr:hypothetical protein [Pseudonocardia cytotoxica]
MCSWRPAPRCPGARAGAALRRAPVRRPLDLGRRARRRGRPARDACCHDPAPVLRVAATAARTGLPDLRRFPRPSLPINCPRVRAPWPRLRHRAPLKPAPAGRASISIEALDRTGLWGRLFRVCGARPAAAGPHARLDDCRPAPAEVCAQAAWLDHPRLAPDLLLLALLTTSARAATVTTRWWGSRWPVIRTGSAFARRRRRPATRPSGTTRCRRTPRPARPGGPGDRRPGAGHFLREAVGGGDGAVATLVGGAGRSWPRPTRWAIGPGGVEPVAADFDPGPVRTLPVRAGRPAVTGSAGPWRTREMTEAVAE